MGIGMVSSAGSGAIRAGRAFVEVFADTSRLRSGLAGASKIVGEFGSRINGLGKVGIGAGITGLVGGIAAFGKLQETAKLGDIADAFGLSSEKASRLFGIMSAGGSDLRDATEGIATFNQRVGDALAGRGEESIEIFKRLGVSADQFTGDSADKFFQLIEALKAVKDPSERVGLLLRAVGEDTGKNLIPLLSMTSAEIRELGDAFVVSTADMETARKTNREYTIAVARISAAWRDVAIAMAPAVTQITRQVKPVVDTLREILARNKDIVPTFLKVSAAIIGVGVAMVVLGKALSILASLGTLISFGAMFVKTLFSLGLGVFFLVGKIAILAPLLGGLLLVLPILATAGGALFKWIKELFSGSITNAASEFKRTFEDIRGTVSDMVFGITNAIRSGEIEKAFTILSLGVQVIWNKMLRGMSRGIAQFLEDNRAVLITLAGLSAAWTGMRWGRIGGGWGMVAGGVAGLAVGTIGADELIDDLTKSLRDTGKTDARIKMLEAEMRGTIKEIAKPGGGAAPALDEAAAMRAAHPELFTLAKDIRTGFQMAGLGSQRFGFGNDIDKEQLKALKDLKDGKGALPMKIGAAVAGSLIMA